MPTPTASPDDGLAAQTQDVAPNLDVENGSEEIYEPTPIDGSELLPDALATELLELARNEEGFAPFLGLLEARNAATEKERDEATVATSSALKQTDDAHRVLKKATQVIYKPFTGVDGKAIDGVQEAFVSSTQRPGFVNWGKTVNFQPCNTLVITKIEGVQHVIEWAKRNDKKVRVAGFRHTWSELFADDKPKNNALIIMFLPLECLVNLPYTPPSPHFMAQSELVGITPVAEIGGRKAPAGQAFFKIMAGTPNSELRKWSFQYKQWCIPFNVIMLEVTFGGTNAPICHGAGLKSTTLSDLVAEVEYVDADGVRRTVNTENELRVASGVFGLLGVVLSVTLLLDEMSVAQLQPVKTPVALAIPPPRGYSIPKPVLELMKKAGIEQDGPQMEAAREDFIRRCVNDYYVEFFWFPYQEEAWVNTWKNRPMKGADDMHLKEYPGNGLLNGSKAQEVQEHLAEQLVNNYFFKKLPGHMQAWALGTGAMLALPDIKKSEDIIQTYVSEALHFRRGIQNFRVRDMEWEIPIPASKTEKDGRNWETVQRAWWDAISEMYAYKGEDAPVRVALEMRITGGSGVVLAPQRGNALGSASIEILTTLTTPEHVWAAFCQRMTDRWTRYPGAEKARPHWAKQWQGLTVRGLPIERYFQEVVYKDAFEEFKTGFEKIVESRGGSVEETLKRFGDPTIKRLVWAA